MSEVEKIDTAALKYDADGLIPVVAQDYKDGTVLMVAYMNKESLDLTLQTGRATYWSRSRKKLWKKGEESGNFQQVKSMAIDCDLDTIVIKVDQIGGAACHTGHRSCFYRERDGQNWKTVGQPLFDPKAVYKK